VAVRVRARKAVKNRLAAASLPPVRRREFCMTKQELIAHLDEIARNEPDPEMRQIDAIDALLEYIGDFEIINAFGQIDTGG
jgi:hypothetical protein